MLDDYSNVQNVAYKIFKNSIVNNKLSHAYLINSHGYSNSYNFVISVVKMIFCDNNYSDINSSKCLNCNICNRIDDGNFLELKVINPDGVFIKKDQLVELQADFSKRGLESKKRVYIINDCDKMTVQAANSLLKFLEEPNDDIISFLITDNINNVLSTIISRCQIISLKSSNYCNENDFKTNIKKYHFFDNCDDNYIEDFKNNVINFIQYFEENSINIVIYLKKYWFDCFKDRKESHLALEFCELLYYDAVKYKEGFDNYFFCDNINDIEFVSNNNSLVCLFDKINLINEYKDLVNRNLNINLLINSLVLKLGDINENCKS